MARNVQHLDGNAIAGILAELMGGDASSLTVACRHCGAHGDMAEVAVEKDSSASIVRCLACGHTLFVVMRTASGGVRLRLEGAAEISSA
jgi:hypothetical protein